MSVVIAVDGPAASGKGTLARRLATAYGFAHLDTGRLYRAAAKIAQDDGVDPRDPTSAVAAARRAVDADLADPALGAETVARDASIIAAIPEARTALLDAQRGFCDAPPGGVPGAVLDGRDIATVVRPEAEVKLFIDASVEIRAQRRFAELREKDDACTYAAVERDLRNRDARDADRAVAPLVIAQDAFVIQTDALDADAVFAAALSFVRSRIGPPLQG
ncbi:MAG: (d)CMP kinase [Pseudomonadota bacterium]